MRISRRTFIKTTVILGSSVYLNGCAAPIKTSDLASSKTLISVDGTKAELTNYLSIKGYTPAKPSSLVTGHSFNGGLLYDEDPASLITSKHYVIQSAARIEDIAKKNNPGTLPLFTLLAFDSGSIIKTTETTELILTYLISVSGLDATRLRVTTTEQARGFFSLFAKYGVNESQIRIRPLDQAKNEGTGSGYFAPKDHPREPSFHSFSFEYILSDGTDLEIAEIGFSNKNTMVSGGFGLERLTMARNDKPMYWDESLPAFKQQVEKDAMTSKLPLPSGYYEILGLPKPEKTML